MEEVVPRSYKQLVYNPRHIYKKSLRGATSYKPK